MNILLEAIGIVLLYSDQGLNAKQHIYFYID